MRLLVLSSLGFVFLSLPVFAEDEGHEEGLDTESSRPVATPTTAPPKRFDFRCTLKLWSAQHPNQGPTIKTFQSQYDPEATGEWTLIHEDVEFENVRWTLSVGSRWNRQSISFTHWPSGDRPRESFESHFALRAPEPFSLVAWPDSRWIRGLRVECAPQAEK